MKCVVDASFAGAWFLPDEHSEASQIIFETYEAGKLIFAAPALLAYELPSMFLMALRRKRLNEHQLDEALDVFNQCKFEWHNQTDRVARSRIVDFARRNQITGYDAAYLELAHRLRIPLLTNDHKLAAAAGNEQVATALSK